MDITAKRKGRFLYAVFIPACLTLFMILVFMLEKGMGWDFHTAGVFPRNPQRLWAVLSYVFIHADGSHLFNNAVSFFVLSAALYYFYKEIANRVFLLLYIFSGLILWVVGRGNWHVGASAVVYALAAFLFFSGVIRRHIPLIAISLVVTFLYGNMFWHLFPWQDNDPVSWEGHLSGGVAGLIMSVVYRKAGPQKPVKVWDEEDSAEEEEEPFWAEKEEDLNSES
ncbi:MAG: rhomboid family intramembrane serine protease [Paludibacteraceae bacterium]|nr:rhomboid family intramembrane serine protease [Paludibacteraceae bacterium]